MQSPFDIAADLDTPVSAYLKLAPFRPRYLLESAEGGEHLGRCSFLGFGDALELRIEDDRVVLDGAASPAPTERDGLLAPFRDALRRAPRPGPEIAGVPFRGGLVGADGLIVEVHPDPEKALSDGRQSLTIAGFGSMMDELRLVAGAVGRRLAGNPAG